MRSASTERTESSMSTAASPPTMPPEEILLAQLPLVERVVGYLAKQHHLSREDAEDLASEVKVKLLENDYAVLRKWKGTSSIKTYLTTCINNLFKDFQNHRWGKWRPCAEARRLGSTAVLLDRLTSRDGNSFERACDLLRTNHGVDLSPEELQRLASRLPPRPPKRVEVDCEDHLQDRPTADASPEEQAIEAERRGGWEKVQAVLDEARAALSDYDQLILKMWNEDNFSVADIARALRCDQKALYRRLDRIKESLRKALKAAGIGPEDLPDLLR
jgi:RNA polymerase sigma factor (sigma-70 family)